MYILSIKFDKEDYIKMQAYMMYDCLFSVGWCLLDLYGCISQIEILSQRDSVCLTDSTLGK